MILLYKGVLARILVRTAVPVHCFALVHFCSATITFQKSQQNMPARTPHCTLPRGRIRPPQGGACANTKGGRATFLRAYAPAVVRVPTQANQYHPSKRKNSELSRTNIMRGSRRPPKTQRFHPHRLTLLARIMEMEKKDSAEQEAIAFATSPTLALEEAPEALIAGC